jgi:Beta protein
MQPALPGLVQFQPVPPGSSHYVVALQTLPGELAALKHAPSTTWARMTPLIQILGPKTPRDTPYLQATVNGWVKKIAAVVGDHPCFLDTLRLSATHTTTTRTVEHPLLSVIHAAAGKRGLRHVPVLRMNSTKRETALIRETALVDRRGIALRYRPLSTALPTGKTVRDLLTEKLAAVEVEITDADLLIDLGFLSGDFEMHAEDIIESADELLSIGDWRSVVLLGTSMPSSLGGGVVQEGTVGRLLRREWTLWAELRRLRLSRLPTFGDYGIQHPDPPLIGLPTGPGQRANIRYTTNEVTLVPRGVGPVVTEGAEQYRDLCRQLVAQPEYAGRDFSWGDQLIADCASGLDDPGWQEHWRGAGTSHHLGQMMRQLASALCCRCEQTGLGPGRLSASQCLADHSPYPVRLNRRQHLLPHLETARSGSGWHIELAQGSEYLITPEQPDERMRINPTVVSGFAYLFKLWPIVTLDEDHAPPRRQ